MRTNKARLAAGRRSVVRSAVVLAAVTGLALTGCARGVSSSGSTPTPGQFGEQAKLSGNLQVLGFGAGDEIATTRYDLAEKAIAPATVKLTEGDLDVQQFLSAVASGKPPGLIYANRNQIGTFASRGAILPLDDCMTGEQIPEGDFEPSALSQVTLNGGTYGIPEFNSVQIIQANADLLKQAGLTTADVNGSDWDKVTAAATRLAETKKGKLSVIGFDSKLPEFLPLWAKANGADLISSDGRKAQLNDPKVVEALTFATKIYAEQGGFAKVKAYRDSADFFGKGNQYASGTLGAMPFEQWYVNVLNDVSPTAPMAFDTFRSRTGDVLAYSTGSAWAIPKGSTNPAAACRFIKTMAAKDSWVAAAQVRADARAKDKKPFTGILTANTAADDAIEAMVDAAAKASAAPVWDAGTKAVYEAKDHTFSQPATPADAEFTAAWQDAVNRVLNGQQEPQAAMDRAQQTAQTALDKGWADWKGR